MQTSTKSKGIFLAGGILIGMLVAFGIVWLDFDRISKDVKGGIQKVFTSNNKPTPDTVKIYVDREVPIADPGVKADTLLLATDTIPIDTFSLQVKKDELLYTKNIKLIRLSDKGKRASIDSSMAKAADVDLIGHPSNFAVEFWKSPVNYKGYKMGRGKLILFGIYQSDDISLVSIDNNVFLKNRNLYFRLEPTEDFCTLNPVTDKNILTQLSK